MQKPLSSSRINYGELQEGLAFFFQKEFLVNFKSSQCSVKLVSVALYLGDTKLQSLSNLRSMPLKHHERYSDSDVAGDKDSNLFIRSALMNTHHNNTFFSVFLPDINHLFSSVSTDINSISCYVGHSFQMVKNFVPTPALNRVHEDRIAFQL